MKKSMHFVTGIFWFTDVADICNHGLKVVGVDVNKEIIHTLSNDGSHIQEPGLGKSQAGCK